jgi:hypothetical protein
MTRQPFACRQRTRGRGACLFPRSRAPSRQSEVVSAATLPPERSSSPLGVSTLVEGLSRDLASRLRPLQVAHRFPNRVSQVRFLPRTRGEIVESCASLRSLPLPPREPAWSMERFLQWDHASGPATVRFRYSWKVFLSSSGSKCFPWRIGGSASSRVSGRPGSRRSSSMALSASHRRTPGVGRSR